MESLQPARTSAQPTAVCPINISNSQMDVSAVILQSAVLNDPQGNVSVTDANSLAEVAVRMISKQHQIAQLVTADQSAPRVNTVILNRPKTGISGDHSYYVCEDVAELKRLLLESNAKKRDAEQKLKVEQQKNKLWQTKVAELQDVINNLQKQLDERNNTREDLAAEACDIE
jgi:hypothetical protein